MRSRRTILTFIFILAVCGLWVALPSSKSPKGGQKPDHKSAAEKQTLLARWKELDAITRISIERIGSKQVLEGETASRVKAKLIEAKMMDVENSVKREAVADINFQASDREILHLIAFKSGVFCFEDYYFRLEPNPLAEFAY